MTGPENYEVAEKLLKDANYLDSAAQFEDAARLSVRAQAHAILALAAATAMASIDRMPDEDYAAWDKAAGVPTRSEDE